jgi:hypothetical protein
VTVLFTLVNGKTKNHSKIVDELTRDGWKLVKTMPETERHEYPVSEPLEREKRVKEKCFMP